MDIKKLYQLYQQHPQITTDSRDCPEGSIFLALKGASFNGNQFALQALEKGCSYAIVDEDITQHPSPTTQHPEPLLCPMLDARRMEVYAALYDRSLKTVREVSADVVTAETYKEYLDERPVYFFGPGAKKCMEVIQHPNAHYIDGIEPLAKWMQPLAERRFLQEQFEDVAYFVPFYLKDFVAIKSKPLL